MAVADFASDVANGYDGQGGKVSVHFVSQKNNAVSQENPAVEVQKQTPPEDRETLATA